MIKASVEHLHHFSCSSCQKWWSIADFPWGSQSHMWCPWCGSKSELPGKPMTGEDFLSEPKPEPAGKALSRPSVDSLYRHRKHDPSAGKYHEYKVVAIAAPDGPNTTSGIYFMIPDISYRHTEGGEPHRLYLQDNTAYASPPLASEHVVYKNINPESCDPFWIYCIRPMDEFMDGRFTLVTS